MFIYSVEIFSWSVYSVFFSHLTFSFHCVLRLSFNCWKMLPKFICSVLFYCLHLNELRTLNGVNSIHTCECEYIYRIWSRSSGTYGKHKLTSITYLSLTSCGTKLTPFICGFISDNKIRNYSALDNWMRTKKKC